MSQLILAGGKREHIGAKFFEEVRFECYDQFYLPSLENSWKIQPQFKLLTHCPNVSTTPLRQWGFRQCLPFSWTALRGKHCQHPIAVMGVVDTFGHSISKGGKNQPTLELEKEGKISPREILLQNFPFP
jgi:hypothetical protein